MNVVAFRTRRSLGICVALFMITACTGSQLQTVPPAAVPQNLASTRNVPMMETCPIVGKTYTRSDGRGKVSITFQEAYSKVGNYFERLRTRVVYSNWPESRQLIYKNLKITTCGPESGKAPVGDAETGGGSFHAECHDGVCTYTITSELRYKPPATLPSGVRKWKFDLISFVPEKPMKGFEPLPSYRIIVNR